MILDHALKFPRLFRHLDSAFLLFVWVLVYTLLHLIWLMFLFAVTEINRLYQTYYVCHNLFFSFFIRYVLIETYMFNIHDTYTKIKISSSFLFFFQLELEAGRSIYRQLRSDLEKSKLIRHRGWPLMDCNYIEYEKRSTSFRFVIKAARTKWSWFKNIIIDMYVCLWYVCVFMMIDDE